MIYMRYDGTNGKEIANFVGSRTCNEIMNAVYPASAKNKILQVYIPSGNGLDIPYGCYIVKPHQGIVVVLNHNNFLSMVKKTTDEWLNPLGYFVDMMAGDYATLMYSHKDAHLGKKHTGIKVWVDEQLSELRCECLCFTDGYSFIRMISGSMSYKNPHLFTQINRMDRIRSLVDAKDAEEKLH